MRISGHASALLLLFVRAVLIALIWPALSTLSGLILTRLVLTTLSRLPLIALSLAALLAALLVLLLTALLAAAVVLIAHDYCSSSDEMPDNPRSSDNHDSSVKKVSVVH